MSQKRESKKDSAWRKVCERTDLLTSVDEKGFFLVSADELKLHSDGFEPRLMAKIDFDFERPEIFKRNKLNILPMKRGSYVVFRDRWNICYYTLPSNESIRHPTSYVPKINLRELDTLNSELCTSETDAVKVAFLSSLLNDFCQTERLQETKSGRFGSSTFTISLPDCKANIEIDSAQLEVDAVFESSDTVALIEAKMSFQQTFLVRQLYYPYQWLRGRTDKKIVPIFLCYSNGEFQLNEFAIGSEFGDLSLVRQEYFVIAKYVLARGDINTLLKFEPAAYEIRTIPFPQADDLDKVVDVVRFAELGVLDKDSLVSKFGFTARQAHYYRSAAKYLGFLTLNGTLSLFGSKLLSEPDRLNRTEIILKTMLGRPVFREAILLLKERNFNLKLISLIEIEAQISRHRPDEYTGQTLTRRAVTVKNWLKWLITNCDFGHTP